MDAFESLIAELLRRKGYWTIQSFKVELTEIEKKSINRPSSPRWELDIVAYKGSTNEILAVECKSFLDSTGVVFRKGTFEPEIRYKLFIDKKLCKVVLDRLALQLQEIGACAPFPKVVLGLAAGKIARKSDQDNMASHFASNGWKLFDPEWIRQQLSTAAGSGYEDDITHVVSKLLSRKF